MREFPHTQLRLAMLRNNAYAKRGEMDLGGTESDNDARLFEVLLLEIGELESLLVMAEEYQRSRQWSGWQLWVLSAVLFLSSVLVGAGLWRLVMG